MKTMTTEWKITEHLQTREEREAYLNAAFEDGDPEVISAALGDIAEAEGLANVAQKTGIASENLKEAFAPGATPAWQTILKIIKSFGFNLRAACL